MEQIEFELYGKPTPKGRPRFANGRTYTDAKTVAAERSILASWLVAANNRPPHDGPIELELVATFTVPTSWPKWRRELALAGEVAHTSKPDFDNLAKIIDGLNGRAWSDDSQIFRASILKGYGEHASTRIRITFHPTKTKPSKEN